MADWFVTLIAKAEELLMIVKPITGKSPDEVSAARVQHSAALTGDVDHRFLAHRCPHLTLRAAGRTSSWELSLRGGLARHVAAATLRRPPAVGLGGRSKALGNG